MLVDKSLNEWGRNGRKGWLSWYVELDRESWFGAQINFTLYRIHRTFSVKRGAVKKPIEKKWNYIAPWLINSNTILGTMGFPFQNIDSSRVGILKSLRYSGNGPCKFALYELDRIDAGVRRWFDASWSVPLFNSWLWVDVDEEEDKELSTLDCTCNSTTSGNDCSPFSNLHVKGYFQIHINH